MIRASEYTMNLRITKSLPQIYLLAAIFTGHQSFASIVRIGKGFSQPLHRALVKTLLMAEKRPYFQWPLFPVICIATKTDFKIALLLPFSNLYYGRKKLRNTFTSHYYCQKILPLFVKKALIILLLTIIIAEKYYCYLSRKD